MNENHITLGLDKILANVAAACHSDGAKDLAISLAPQKTLPEAQTEQDKTRAAMNIIIAGHTPNISKLFDPSFPLKKADSGSPLSIRELMDIRDILRNAASLKAWKEKQNNETPLDEYFDLIWGAVDGIDPALLPRLERSFLSEDELADEASPTLASIRKQITHAENAVKEVLQQIIKTKSKILQEAIITNRFGRYCIPVKQEHRGEIKGLVHDRSASGASLFIEPAEALEKGNKIRELQSAERDEIDRILAELSAAVSDNGMGIAIAYDGIIHLDFYFAAARAGDTLRGTFPLLTDNGYTNLINARHPEIDEKAVVPISIELGKEYQTLIITGPNTGGKTVALKTLGLLTLMAMCGIAIPASADSAVSIYENVLADIGDEQSIEQSLSTFSSHMTRIVSILRTTRHMGQGTLVLLDEPGGGTDPREGAALAMAIITKLREDKARCAVSTHYPELKAYAISTDGVINASCEFDEKTLSPTYRLIVGSPGASGAFKISKKLGLPDEIIEAAKSMLSESDNNFDTIASRLEASRRDFEAKERKLAEDLRGLAEQKKQLEQKIETIEAARKAELDKAKTAAEEIVFKARNQSSEILADLLALKHKKDKADFSALVSEAVSGTDKKLSKVRGDADVVSKPLAVVTLKTADIGDTVKLLDIGKTGEITKAPDKSGRVSVKVGAVTIHTKLSNLTSEESEKPKKKPKKVNVSVQKSSDKKGAAMEIDLRGMLSDEAVMATDNFIDGAIMSHVDSVRIIHGKGTGALRKAIEAFLKKDRRVKSYRAGAFGEGDSGVTVAEL